MCVPGREEEGGQGHGVSLGCTISCGTWRCLPVLVDRGMPHIHSALQRTTRVLLDVVMTNRKRKKEWWACKSPGPPEGCLPPRFFFFQFKIEFGTPSGNVGELEARRPGSLIIIKEFGLGWQDPSPWGHGACNLGGGEGEGRKDG